MCAQSTDNFPPEMPDLVLRVFEANSLDPSSATRVWARNLELNGVKGVLAIARLEPERFFAVANMPVLVMPKNGVTLSFAETLQLVTCIADIPGAQYAMQGSLLFFTWCAQLGSFEEGQIEEILDGLLEGVEGVRQDLLTAFNHFFPGEEKPEVPPEPKLPNIKMTPDDMRVIRCTVKVQSACTRSISFSNGEMGTGGILCGNHAAPRSFWISPTATGVSFGYFDARNKQRRGSINSR